MTSPNGTAVTAAQIQALREQTGAGIMECKRALQENQGDTAKAKDWLRDRGIAIAAKKGGRLAKDGLVGSYIHHNGKMGALVELNCETDFVARTPDFQSLLRDLCFQVAASNPRWLNREEVPPAGLDEKRKEFEAEAAKDGKPADKVARIAEGKLDKYLSENCLLEQAYVQESSGKVRVKDLLTEATAKLGENIVIRRFVRFQVGGE